MLELDDVVKEAVEVFEEEMEKGWIDDINDVREFAEDEANIYLEKMNTEEHFTLLERLNMQEPIAEFGINEEDKTVGQAVMRYLENTLTGIIIQAVIDCYYDNWI